MFIIVEGEATFVTGGTLVGSRETAEGQRRAAGVQGGETHHLTQGRRDHDSREDAALVQGSADADDRVLRGQHGAVAVRREEYLLSVPERLVRAVLGLGAGAAREVGEVALPDGVRKASCTRTSSTPPCGS